MTTLFNLVAEDQAFEDLLLMDDGELDEAGEALLAEHLSQMGDKIDAYGFLLQKWAGEEETATKLADDFKRKAKQRERAQDRLKARLVGAMTAMQRDKIAGTYFEVSRVQSKQSVQVMVPAEALPTSLQRVTVEVKPDKTAIAALLKQSKSGRLVADDIVIAEWAPTTFHARITP